MKKLNKIEVIDKLFDELYPICRSITGKGLRKSLNILMEYIPLEMISFKTGTKVLNWSIPQEWNIKEAWLKDCNDNTIVDFKDNNLHIINYSEKVNEELDLEQLKQHIYTLPNLPDAIPYITSYYKRRWGFCMSQNQYNKLTKGKYRVFIDSEFIDGELNLGHTLLKGKSDKEMFLSSYLCHPSMANNELSGPIVLAMVYQRILNWKNRNLTYRFVINPETIGSISYLSRYGKELKEKMYSGLVLTCLGGYDKLHYKTSRNEKAPINDLINHLKSEKEIDCDILEFTPLGGSDERQYCSPGFNLPVGQLSRLTYGAYKEYHTSLDNKKLMGIENLIQSADEIEKILKANDINGYYINKYPYGEIKLGDYDLYPTLNNENGDKKTSDNLVDGRDLLNNILMILNYSDGKHKLSDIASKLGKCVLELENSVNILKEKELLDGPYFEEDICL